MKYLRIGLQLLAYLIVTYPQNKSHYHRENMLVTISHSPRWLGKFNFYLMRFFFYKSSFPKKKKTMFQGVPNKVSDRIQDLDCFFGTSCPLAHQIVFLAPNLALFGSQSVCWGATLKWTYISIPILILIPI